MFFTTSIDVAQRMSERGFSLRLDDNPQAITQVLREATNQILRFLLPNYNQSDLQNDALSGGPDGQGGMTKELATDLAVCKLAARRGNAVASSWKDVCKEAKETLAAMRDDANNEQLPNVPLAQPHYPAWSNVRVVEGYLFRRVRVETTTSDVAPSGNSYPQAVDWLSVGWIEF